MAPLRQPPSVLAREMAGMHGSVREVVEAATHNGAGCLHAAAALGQMALCFYLVEELMVNLEAVDNYGDTPFNYAVRHRQIKVQKYLRHKLDELKKESPLLYVPVKGNTCNTSSLWEDKDVRLYVNWQDYIPAPSYMVLPHQDWKGTCIAHAFGECLTSRRRIMTARSKEPIMMSGDVSIPWLIYELAAAYCITSLGGRAEAVSEFILKNGAPLEGRTDRAQMREYSIIPLVNLQDICVFDMPDHLYSNQLSKTLNQRASLLREIGENGPVVGLFNAGSNWPDANGEVYHDLCENVMLRSKANHATHNTAHAALIYGFDNTAQDPFAVELLLQDNNGPTAHTKGQCRMDISSLRGYIVLDVVCNSSRSRYSTDVSSRSGEYLGKSVSTNCGENDKIKYASSYMQGWNDNVEDIHVILPDLDASTSFFGIYDGHGGTSVASYCADHFHTEMLKHANDTTDNAIAKAFFSLDEKMVNQWGEFKKNIDADVWPSMKALSKEWCVAEGSTACVVVIRENELTVGTAGDSRAVLSRNGQAIDLTTDHRVKCQWGCTYPCSATANREVTKEFGIPVALGNLDISKVIGFVPFKEYTDLSSQEFWVTCAPEIRSEDITDWTDFLIIASDGLWNNVCSQSAVDFINRDLKRGETDLGAICERLIDFYNAGGDNMTVILVQLKKPSL